MCCIYIAHFPWVVYCLKHLKPRYFVPWDADMGRQEALSHTPHIDRWSLAGEVRTRFGSVRPSKSITLKLGYLVLNVLLLQSTTLRRSWSSNNFLGQPGYDQTTRLLLTLRQILFTAHDLYCIVLYETDQEEFEMDCDKKRSEIQLSLTLIKYFQGLYNPKTTPIRSTTSIPCKAGISLLK
jgi:hypothetical protein